MAKKKKEVDKNKIRKNMTNNAQALDILIRSRHPIIYIVTHEEDRVMTDIEDIATLTEKTVYNWDCVNGIVCNEKNVKPNDPNNQQDETDPYAVLDFIRKNVDDIDRKDKDESKREGSFFVLCDFFRWLQNPIDPKIERMLRVIANDIVRIYSTIIIVSPERHIPSSLDKRVTIVDYDYPTKPEIENHLDYLLKNVKSLPGFEKYTLKPNEREAVIKATQGLTLQEADNAYSKSLVETRTISAQKINEEKKQIILKNGLLEFVETKENMEDIGGMKYLVEWLKKRKEAFTDKAMNYGLPVPNGLLLIGIQGCGKSLAAKATAIEWEMPLLRLDIGRMFGGFVGDSERNIRDALSIAESVAPCVLWLDEVDKGISGVQSSGRTDGGTTSRVYGTMLTWLQEKTKPVFVIATANNVVDRLDPAFLRKGRFDDIFFVNLPMHKERVEIAKIHIEKRNRNSDDFDLEQIADATKEFSGAEIEGCIYDALHEGFYDGGREITTEDIVTAADELFPLAEVMGEELGELRNWAIDRAKNAAVKIGPKERKADGADRVSSLEID